MLYAILYDSESHDHTIRPLNLFGAPIVHFDVFLPFFLPLFLFSLTPKNRQESHIASSRSRPVTLYRILRAVLNLLHPVLPPL